MCHGIYLNTHQTFGDTVPHVFETLHVLHFYDIHWYKLEHILLPLLSAD
jgi:hypothetical protein